MRLGKVSLTCEVMFLRHVVPRKERYFDVVHVDEPRAEKEKRDGHTTGPKMSANGNVLSLHERCSSEDKQKDINATKDQKEIVGLLKEDRITGRFRSSHGGLVDGGVRVVKGTRYVGISTPETGSRDPFTI